MEFANQLILVAGLLFITSIMATVVTPRLGVPLLLVFLVVGMLAGEDGPGGIRFDDYSLANLAGTAALAVILFDGGMRTQMRTFRVGLRPAIGLATIGVLVTAGITGAFAAWLLDLKWAEGLLIGAIVGSTDAAAVFALLGTSSVHLNERVSSALEIESGTNDPMAVFLTLALLEYLRGSVDYHIVDSLLLLLQQLGLGLGLGLGGGWLLVWALNRFQFSESLYPLMVLFSGLVIFGLTATLGGSGYLAVYLAGVWLGNHKVRGITAVRRVHDGVAWMAQIGMFVILGLLVTPTTLFSLTLPALAIALVLMLVARPVAVFLTLTPFRFPFKEKLYIAWVGLRGSVPIVLATYPLLIGVENAFLFFNVAFFIVLVSLLIQGWSLAPVARWLGLQLPERTTRVNRIDLDLPGTHGYEIVSYRIGENSPMIGMKSGELPLADHSRIICLARRGRVINYRDGGALRNGDYLALLASQDELPKLDSLFESQARPGSPRPARKHFFGEFRIDPRARIGALADVYAVVTTVSIRERTVAEYITGVIPKPVVGDRVRFGELELVVTGVDGNLVTEVGLRLPS